MKIVPLKNLSHGGKIFPHGEEADFPDNIARSLIASGSATPIRMGGGLQPRLAGSGAESGEKDLQTASGGVTPRVSPRAPEDTDRGSPADAKDEPESTAGPKKKDK